MAPTRGYKGEKNFLIGIKTWLGRHFIFLRVWNVSLFALRGEVAGCSSKSSLNWKIWYNKQNCVYGINPLTCTIFDPAYFGSILRNHVSHISPTRLKKSIMTTSTLVLKSHTRATHALTGARECWLVYWKNGFVHYYSFFSVFGLWHKANFAHFSGSNEKICFQIKNLTCNLSFSELTSHTTKEISSASCPVFTGKSLILSG